MHNALYLIEYSAAPSTRWWATIVAAVGRWRERSRTRTFLAGLDDRGLADVGLTRSNQRRQWAKPLWRA